jgi:hypothetical protein
VLDGHGGPDVANFAALNLPTVISFAMTKKVVRKNVQK